VKRFIITAAQLLITVGVLWWVFHDPDKRAQMADALRRADKSWFLAALVVYGFVELVATVRWQILLRVQGIYLGWIRAGMLLMIGVFFNLFMLGATGGDVVKIYYLLKETPGKKAAAFLAVLMDRVIGLLALVSITGLLIGYRYEWLTQNPTTAGLANFVLLLMAGAIAAIAFSFLVTGFNLVHRLPQRFPFRETFIELSVAYNLYGRAWRASIAGFILSIAAHVGYFLTFYYVARAFTSKVPLIDFLSIMPIVNTITALPISFSGIGWREFLFEKLLKNLSGIPEAVSVMISSTGFLVVVVWSIIGGLLYLLYRPSAHVHVSEMVREVDQLEERIAKSE
jgi:glycosyltransferase 2 family protein